MKYIFSALMMAAAIPAQGRTVATYEILHVTSQYLADTDGDGRQEVLLVCYDAATAKSSLVRVGTDDSNQQMVQRGEITISDPAHTLISIADLLPANGDEVIMATPKRTSCMPWPSGDTLDKPIVLARSARFNLRVGRPQLSPFIIDLNKDGLLDMMLPTLQGVQPYFQEQLGEDGMPIFRRMKTVTVPISTKVGVGTSGLDQELTGSISISQINTEDLNGDGRPDLLTNEGMQRAFHLQRTDGTFADPIQIDISQFVDSTPKATMDLGATAVLNDRQQIQRGDINGDGIPDHVIVHRRKIWTFLGDSSGPQFKNARTQAVADDVTQLLLTDLDNDDSDDLLTFRVRIPGLASILLGLVQSIDIDVRAVGYRSEQNGFAGTPEWRRTVTVRVPPLLSLLSRQDELIERFTGLVNKTRISARGSFVTEGQSDLALVKEDGSAIDLYPKVAPAPELSSDEGSQMLRSLLFEDEDTIFDLERVFGLISGFVDRFSDQGVDQRSPSATIKLRDTEEWSLTNLDVCEFDGTPGDELLATYRAANDPELRAYDLLKW